MKKILVIGLDLYSSSDRDVDIVSKKMISDIRTIYGSRLK